jgi:hypothetical protein
MRINAVINACERTGEPLAFTSTGGLTFVSLRDAGNLVFAIAETGVHLYQEAFVERHRWDLFEPADSVPEIVSHDDVIEDDEDQAETGLYPDLDEVMDWANDPETTDEELQSYLAEVAGEPDRKRKRANHVKLITEYVDAQA